MERDRGSDNGERRPPTSRRTSGPGPDRPARDAAPTARRGRAVPAVAPTEATPSPVAEGTAGAPGDETGAHFRHAYRKDRAQLLRRLSRMEGQVRGIARMVDRDDYCIDILQQTAALRAAVDSVALLVMEDHVAGCLAHAVETGDAAAYTEEVMDVVRRSLGRPVRASRPAAD